MSDTFKKFSYYHHSPSAVQKPLEIDLFQKLLKARGESFQFGSPVTIGRAVEDVASAVLVNGMDHKEALRHGTSVLDSHEAVPWEQNDMARLDLHRGDTLEAMSGYAIEAISQALSKANQIKGQERLDKKYAGIVLPFLGYSDFYGGNRVVELKVKTTAVSDSKAGRRAGSLPSKPDSNHATQVTFYADVLNCPATLVYVSEKGFKIFDETNCEELSTPGFANNLKELKARAWARENIMRCAPDTRTLMQMLSPNFQDWGWKMNPEHLEEARAIWGLNQS